MRRIEALVVAVRVPAARRRAIGARARRRRRSMPAPRTPTSSACRASSRSTPRAARMFGRVRQRRVRFSRDHEVVLTFDDGPLRPYTRAVLKALDAHCTKATFFMVGRMAVADPAMVREVAEPRPHDRRAYLVARQIAGARCRQGKGRDRAGLQRRGAARCRAPIAPFFRFPYLRPSTAVDRLPEVAQRRELRHRRQLARLQHPRWRRGQGRRCWRSSPKRRKGILLFHDIQPSTAHAHQGHPRRAQGARLQGRAPRAEGARRPRSPITTRRPTGEIAHRKLAAAKQPLAPRSLVWSQTGSAKHGETLPVGATPALPIPNGQTTTKASRTRDVNGATMAEP